MEFKKEDENYIYQVIGKNIKKYNSCGIETKMPIQVVKHFKNIYEIAGNSNLPTFDCTNCNGQLKPENPMDL